MFEIGNSLREARARRKLSYDQVEAETKIRAKYIRCREEEEYDALPSETYVKGFLRTYADYLGLDGQLYVDEFNSRFGQDERENRTRRSSARPQQRNRRSETLVLLAVLTAIVVVTVVVISAWKSSGGDHPARAPQKTHPRKQASSPAYYLVLKGSNGSSSVAIRKQG